MQCVSNRLVSCPSVRGFVSGALRWVRHRRLQRRPAPRGVTQRVATPDTIHPSSRAPVKKRSRTVCPTLFAFRGSRRLWVVNPRTRVSRHRIHDPCLARTRNEIHDQHSTRDTKFDLRSKGTLLPEASVYSDRDRNQQSTRISKLGFQPFVEDLMGAHTLFLPEETTTTYTIMPPLKKTSNCGLSRGD